MKLINDISELKSKEISSTYKYRQRSLIEKYNQIYRVPHSNPNFLCTYYVQSEKSIHQYFRFFRKRVVNIAILENSNESPGNFTFYRGIHEFFNSPIFEKITVFKNRYFLENRGILNFENTL